jgi:hypothetical protein
VAADTTYLYKVKAVVAAVAGLASNVDLATTVLFPDDPLIAGTTAMKASHLSSLQTAVNAVRASAGLDSAVYESVASGAVIKASHVTELRTALDTALDALSFTPIAYVDPTLIAGTTKPKDAHVTQLRTGVK